MTDSEALERAYRRMLACYPRSLRRDNEDEILAVLMATAGEGQTRVRLADACFLRITMVMIIMLAQNVRAFASADMIAVAVEWALGLASVVLVLTPASCRYYRPPVTAAQP